MKQKIEEIQKNSQELYIKEKIKPKEEEAKELSDKIEKLNIVHKDAYDAIIEKQEKDRIDSNDKIF